MLSTLYPLHILQFHNDMAEVSNEKSTDELCSILENVTEEDTDNKFLKRETALEHLLELVRKENEESDSGQISLNVKTSLTADKWAKILIVCVGHLGRHYWTNSSVRKLAKGNADLFNSTSCNFRCKVHMHYI